jgi:hypothetical protein
MHDQPMNSMTVENVSEFDVWILNSSDLVVSILPVFAPWNAVAENYDISQSDEN